MSTSQDGWFRGAELTYIQPSFVGEVALAVWE